MRMAEWNTTNDDTMNARMGEAKFRDNREKTVIANEICQDPSTLVEHICFYSLLSQSDWLQQNISEHL